MYPGQGLWQNGGNGGAMNTSSALFHRTCIVALSLCCAARAGAVPQISSPFALSAPVVAESTDAVEPAIECGVTQCLLMWHEQYSGAVVARFAPDGSPLDAVGTMLGAYGTDWHDFDAATNGTD